MFSHIILIFVKVAWFMDWESRVEWGGVGGDQILLMAQEMSLLCSGEPTAETKSILDEAIQQSSTGASKSTRHPCGSFLFDFVII